MMCQYAYHRGSILRESLCVQGQNINSKPTHYLSISANFIYFYFYVPLLIIFLLLQVIVGIIISNYFCLSIIGILTCRLSRGRSACLHLVDFGFGPMTHFDSWKHNQTWHWLLPSRGFNCVAWFKIVLLLSGKKTVCPTVRTVFSALLLIRRNGNNLFCLLKIIIIKTHDVKKYIM